MTETIAATPYNLSDREVQVLRSIAGGRDSAGTGALLGLSQHTVREYVKRAMGKMGVHCRTSAMIKAERAGLLAGVEVR